MTIEELITLEDGAIIRCSACECDGSEFILERYTEDCGCFEIKHSNKVSPLAFGVCAKCYEHRMEDLMESYGNPDTWNDDDTVRVWWDGVTPEHRERIEVVEP